jgi:magnesium-transporting ATPase (P-type)
MNVVSIQMAKKGLKVLSYGFKEVPAAEFETWRQQWDEESAEYREALESDLIYLATFGLDDPLRQDIKESIQMIKYGYIGQIKP